MAVIKPKASLYHPLLTPLLVGLSISTLWSFDTQAMTDEDDLEVISVTASKRLQTLNEIPASVSVINTETLARIEGQHINQVLSRVAGTWISRGNGQEHLTAIRSPVLTGAGGCGAFFMALDGIALRAPGFCNANQLFDANSEQAARIEVLKGPASTLYGTNAVHGAINIISPDAFNPTRNNIGLQLGAYDFARVSTQLNWQNETQAFSLMSNLTQEDGYQTESGYDQQKVTLIYQQRTTTWNNKTLIDIANLNQETAGFIRGFESYKDENFRKINPNPEAFRDAKSLRAYSQFTRAFGDGTLSLKPYLRWNEMQFLQHFLPWQALEENSHSSLGLQAQYDIDFAGANWVTGIDIDATGANLTETQAQAFSPSIPAGNHYDYDVDARAIAAYAQANWQWQNWALSLGGRFERTEYDYDNLLSDGSACDASVAVCRFTRPSDQKLSFSAFSPALVLEYQPTEDLLTYTKISQGFRAPEATELFRLQDNQISTDFEEVSIDAIEFGLRYNLDGHSLHIAAYDMQKDNVIIRDTNRQNIAGGETSHRGLEIEYLWQVTDVLRISSNLTWQKHSYASDQAISNVSIKGNRVDTSPDRLFGLQALWQPNEKLSAEFAWQHLSKYYLDPENTAEYDGHSLLDLTFRYVISERLSAKINILNITDEDYAERADFAFGGYRYFVGQPRRAFVSIKWIL
ncbi:TonB-dependent receptor [Glaciecola sp. SC05]|uniref:TonB-dependent receptor n=1 Tax=Glaciecola sp. SC05 TaxID=1987355 RepID=UPI0035290E4C